MGSEKKVVIIGGGFAGTEVAKQLEGLLSVTLIDTKDYFEFTPSVLRAVVEPKKLKTIQVPHSSFLHKDITLLQGEVTKVETTDSSVTYTSKGSQVEETLSYDYLVITSGSRYNLSFTNPNIICTTKGSHLVDTRDKLQTSDSVIIVGGGYVGVELAAEIITEYPKKKVVLVHNGSRLLSRSSERASKYALNFFQKRGVEVYLNEKIDFESIKNQEKPFESSHEVVFESNSGKTFEGNLAYVCIGISPNASYIVNDNFKDNGKIKVNEYFQTSIASNVFACGDVCSVNEEKLAQSALAGAWTTAGNILSSINNSPGNFSSYRPSTVPIVISLGKKDAIFTLGNLAIGGFFASLLKELVEWKVLVAY